MEIHPDQTAEEKLAFWVDKVRALPKISVDDPRVTDSDIATKPIQYGNNFYMLWQYIMRDPSETDAIMGGIISERINEYPLWDEFMHEQHEIIDRIKVAVEETLDPYLDVFHCFIGYLNDRDFEAIKQLEDACEHPLGLTSANVYVWDQLNPLFEEVSTAMRLYDIEPERFSL